MREKINSLLLYIKQSVSLRCKYMLHNLMLNKVNTRDLEGIHFM